MFLSNCYLASYAHVDDVASYFLSSFRVGQGVGFANSLAPVETQNTSKPAQGASEFHGETAWSELATEFVWLLRILES